MCQKASGVTDATPYSPNPFNDTANPRVLKTVELGIVKGSDDKFMPKAISDAQKQKAIGYANTSREQALAMSVRPVEKLK